MARRPNVRVQLGRRVRDLRRQRQLTQERLADRAELSTRFLGQVERGEANPSLVAMDAIAAALDVEFRELLQFEESRIRVSTGRAAGGGEARERIVEYLSGRSPGDLERAMRILAAALEDTPEVS